MNGQKFIIRLEEIENLKRKKNSKKQLISNNEKGFKPGISVIIPTYKGEKYIERCLKSVFNQTLSQLLFEVVIIINGEKDRTEFIIDELINYYDVKNIKVQYLKDANVSKARNLGIELSNREYITFLDDDDYISNNYLENMYRYSSTNTVVVSQIIDFDDGGTETTDNVINKQIIESEKIKKVNLMAVTNVMSMNACKTLPSSIVKNYRYDTKLKSGEDVVYFTELLINNTLNIKIIPSERKVFYYRFLRESSISRQKMNFDFNVSQRLDVIKILDDFRNKTNDSHVLEYIHLKIKGQLSFIRKYLFKNIEDKDKIVDEIYQYKISNFPFEDIENIGL